MNQLKKTLPKWSSLAERKLKMRRFPQLLLLLHLRAESFMLRDVTRTHAALSHSHVRYRYLLDGEKLNSSLEKKKNQNDIAGKSSSLSLSATSTPISIILAQQETLAGPSAGVFTDEDIIQGFLLGVSIALGFAFLQNLTSSQLFVPWQFRSADEISPASTSDFNSTVSLFSESEESFIDGQTNNSSFSDTGGSTTFGEESWKEISRPENYVWYSRRNQEGKLDTQKNGALNPLQQQVTEKDIQYSAQNFSPFRETKKENRLILFSLLLLFVPIFSIEFFFALSRLVICEGDIFSQSDLSYKLCSPASLINEQ